MVYYYVTLYTLLEQSQMCCIYYTGESHFNAAQNPHLYFQVLLLSQQFESVRAYVTIATYSVPSNS